MDNFIDLQQQTHLFKALADTTRLRLLRVLFREQLNVQELAIILQIGQPSISRHLAVLKKCGFVKDRREGTKAYYELTLNNSNLTLIKNYITEIGKSQHPDLERLEQCLYSRIKKVHSFADSAAGHWDEIGRQLHNTTASLLASIKLVPQKLTLADLGTGTGIMLPFLAELGEDVYAIDQSAQMLKQAELRCKRHNINNVTFIQSSIENLSKKLPLCDGILLHFVLHQLARPESCLKSCKKLLKTNGHISIVDRIEHQDENARKIFGSVWLGFSALQIKNWLKKAGFKNKYWHSLAGDLSDNNSKIPIFVAAATKQ